MSYVDPEARWALIRAEWLGRRRARAPSRCAPRDAVFATRLQLLDTILSLPLDGPTPSPAPAPLPASESSSGLLLNPSAQSDPKLERNPVPQEDEPEPDGGDVIARRTLMPPPPPVPPVSLSQGSNNDAERAVEGIMTAFRLGRALKEPLPLSLVTKMLYRSWLLDGTIPPGYVAYVADETPSAPVPDNYPRPARPHWLDAATSRATPTAAAATPANPGFATEWVPPNLAALSSDKVAGRDETRVQAGKLEASGWRAEADVASGDDVL